MKISRPLRVGGKTCLSLVLMFLIILLFVPEVLASGGYSLAAKEVTLDAPGSTTTSPVLSPVAGAAIRFSFESPATGNIAVYASFSSSTAQGSEAKTGTWDLELFNVQDGTTVVNSQDIERYLEGITDQGMVGVCAIFGGLKQNTSYEVRLRHATSVGVLRTKNVDMVLLPLFSGSAISLNYAQDVTTAGVSTSSISYVDTDLVGSIALDPGTTGAYVLITAAMNAESEGRGRAKIGSWRLQVGQGGSYHHYGVPVQRSLSGTGDIGAVVLHALAGPFHASEGAINFRVQHKTSNARIRTSNATLIAVALSDYDKTTGTQYDFVSGQEVQTGNMKTNSAILAAAHNAGTGQRIRVSPDLRSHSRIFLGAYFGHSTPVPATVTYDIARDGSAQVQSVHRVTGMNDIGVGCLFGLSDPLEPGVHHMDLRHSTTSMLNTASANLVYVVLAPTVHPPR